jgi:hypothetical protein
MEKKNPHCPVPGCKTKKPHLSSPTIAGIHHVIAKPETTAAWAKMCIVELVQSVESDVLAHRYFAYLTRWRHTEELYYRALFVIFCAEQTEIPHIASNETPNGFSAMWRKVNEIVYDGKLAHDQKQLGLSGEEFTAMEMLNSVGHASFATIVALIDVSKNRDEWKPRIDKHMAYWKQLCTNLNFIEKGFKEGKSRAEALAEFKARLDRG